jgi:anthraniloyl-CoA monooxygenase
MTMAGVSKTACATRWRSSRHARGLAEGKPISVRISANDWVGEDGVTPDEAVEIARAFADAGADLIDVSAGADHARGAPVYGRMFQTPFSDRIRNEAGLKTMAVTQYL